MMDFIYGSMKCCGTFRSFQPETDEGLQGPALGFAPGPPGPRDMPAAWLDAQGKAKWQPAGHPVVCEEEGGDCPFWVSDQKAKRICH